MFCINIVSCERQMSIPTNISGFTEMTTITEWVISPERKCPRKVAAAADPQIQPRPNCSWRLNKHENIGRVNISLTC